MQIRAPSRNVQGEKELKVKLPVRLHLQLHALKLVTGTTISAAVRDALDAYIEEEVLVPQRSDVDP